MGAGMVIESTIDWPGEQPLVRTFGVKILGAGLVT